MSFTFTPEQVQQFRTEGWLAVPHFWNSEEVAAMRAELDRLRAQGLINNVATDGDSKTISQTKVNLQLCPMSPHSSFYRAMPFAPKVGEAVEQLIGGPVVLHLDQVFIKPGGQGAGTNWHQDNAYFKIENPLHGTAIWTAVHDATLANGTMRIIPNMFNEELEHTRDPDSNHHIRCYPDESKAIPVELEAGGVIFFAYGTPHSTGGNSTEHERAGVALHFLNAAARVKGDAGFNGDSRPIITGPTSTGGEREYGQRIAGTWESEVAKLV